MKLFGTKKGNENMRTLTEKEIQDKLYGKYRSSQNLLEEEVPVSDVKPEALASGHHPADLFQTKSSSAEKKEGPVTSSASASFSPGTKNQKKFTVKHVEQKNSGAGLLKILGVIFNILKSIFSAFGKVLQVLASSIANFFLSVDFRKPEVKKAVSWIGGLCILFAIFLGIHFLNVQREAAMKVPHKHVAVKKEPAKKEASAAPATEDTDNSLSKPQSDATQVQEPSQSKDSKPASARASKSANPVKERVSGKAEGKGTFVIQVATFAIEGDASRLVDQLKEEKLNAFSKPLSRSGGRTYYCVFIGRFLSYGAAQGKLSEFRKKAISKSFQDSFIRPL